MSWSEAHSRFVAGHPEKGAPPDPHFDSNPWPEEAEAPGFKDEMQRYHAAMEGVGEAVLRSVARALGRSALGVDEDGAAASWAGGVSTLRPMRYPEPPKGWEAAAEEYTVTEEGRLITAGAHCDNGTGISLLWQSSAGLEVRSPTTGEWLAVPHEAEGCEGSLLSVHVVRCPSLFRGAFAIATSNGYSDADAGQRPRDPQRTAAPGDRAQGALPRRLPRRRRLLLLSAPRRHVASRGRPRL